MFQTIPGSTPVEPCSGTWVGPVQTSSNPTNRSLTGVAHSIGRTLGPKAPLPLTNGLQMLIHGYADLPTR
jgi:hypothetical protein